MSAADVRSDVEICFRKTPCSGFSAGFNAYCTDESNEYLLKLADCAENVCGTAANIGYFQSIGDFNHFGGGLNIPTVLLGADGLRFHGSDECVDLKSALDTANILLEFITQTLACGSGE